MKEQELRKGCGVCGGKIFAKGPMILKMSIEPFLVNPAEIERQAGLEQMLGSTPIAQAMGTDADMANSIGPSLTFLVCNSCAEKKVHNLESLYKSANAWEEEEW